MTQIRQATEQDWSAIWQLLQPVFKAGETYVYSPDITETDAKKVWMDNPEATFVAVDEVGTILGTYYLKPNHPGLGSHVGNCGYIVGEHARGKGVATALGIHSQEEALRRGFKAIQFNFVVSTNTVALQLWQKLGFKIVGTLPGAYRHQKLGFVDAVVMYKRLSESR